MAYFPYSVVFVIGHMRSRSTLLTDILQTAGCTSGADEYQMSFRTIYDLHRMFNLVTKHQNYDPGKMEFITNTIHHNRLEISPEILDFDKLKVIITYRSPASFFPSMAKFVEYNDIIQYKNLETRYWYYVSRLQYLEYYYRRLPKSRVFTIETDLFAKEPRSVLDRLQSFLGTEKHLPTKYVHFNRRLGDNTPTIKTAGKIVYENKQDPNFHPDPDKVDLANRLYTRLHKLFTGQLTTDTIDYETYLKQYRSVTESWVD